jgi:hypothetical protein
MARALPPKMHLKFGGYYYVHQNRWISLGRDRAKALKEYEAWHCGIRGREVQVYADNVFWRAQRNAKVRGIEFSLTKDDYKAILHRANGRCEITGIPFSLAKHERGAARRPFAPSLDRIDCHKTYTPDNCRLVAVAVNAAMSDWGEDVLYRIAAGLSRRSKRSVAFI